MERANPAHLRLDLPEIVFVDESDAGRAVLACAHEQVVEAGELVLVDGDDDLAALLVRDAVLVAVRVELTAALHAEARLQRARRVVDAGVDDTAVVTRLVARRARLLLEHEHAQAV